MQHKDLVKAGFGRLHRLPHLHVEHDWLPKSAVLGVILAQELDVSY